MGGLLKPIKKIFKKRNLKKIGIGLGVAAAAILTGGAIMGMASGVGPLAGMGAAAGKVGSALGIGSATAAPAAAAATGGAAIPAAAGGFGSGGLAAGSVLPAAVSTAAGTTALSTGAAAPAFAGGASLGPGLGLGLGAAGPTAISTGGGALGAAASAGGGIPSATNAALTAGGGAALDTGARTAPLTRPAPQTPAQAARRSEAISPLVPGGQPNGMFQTPQFQAPEELGPPIFENVSFDGVPSQSAGGGLLQTARTAAGAAGDWWNRLPAITQYSLLRFGEGAFAPTPRNSVDEQIRLEDRRRARNRSPVYSGGRFI